jgi:ribosomal protein S27AE
MRLRIDVVCEQDGHTDQSHKLIVLARDELAMETLGLSLPEGKQLLQALQSYMVDQQVAEYLEQHLYCPRCGASFGSVHRKGPLCRNL